jgi:DNA invertase Pin-like site-specific DNA recombinase
MVELIGSGKVKAVIAADISRLSRNLGDLITFLALAARQRAVLILDRRPVDPRNHSDIFVSQILGNVAEYDNRIRTDTMVRARIAKAKNGEIVIPLPIGYTKLNDGTVVMNPEVKDSIELIIQTFREEKSLLGTVRSLRKRNIKLPTKRRKGRVDWIDATTIRVGGILMNPAYAGTFAYGRSEHNPDSKRPTKRPPRRPVPEDRWIKTYNRLPAYITVEEQQKFRQIVTGNRFSNRHRIGRGSALLQGLLVCSICGAKLIVSYYGGK